ncbi:hypothetical protein NDU88_001050 [Pleurodeles waltl]|uniref:Uncharacterized protein n=1 Tax=Pleurodeles waltl TaxID=8319 RepID=A0AAV7Q5X3_PLEWA|nr:hypothetical protein NDU88_001050 [Pleurodeles waltl]
MEDLDERMATFLGKCLQHPKKDINQSWCAYQDKLLDLVGPLTHILGMAEDAKASWSLIPPEVISGWAQRAIIVLGDANRAISTERHYSLLIKIDPKLGDLATSVVSPIAQGGLFGDPLIREQGKFVRTFNSLDKVHTYAAGFHRGWPRYGVFVQPRPSPSL